jgi:hypothetical protein
MSDDDESLSGNAGRGAGRSRKKSKTSSTATAPQKFTQKTKAFKHLQKLFVENAIDPTERPVDVWKKDPLFQDFTQNQFRSQFNKLKNHHGLNTKEGESIMHSLYLLQKHAITQWYCLLWHRLSQKDEGC